jgi:hypothetical protein
VTITEWLMALQSIDRSSKPVRRLTTSGELGLTLMGTSQFSIQSTVSLFRAKSLIA